MHKAVTSGFVPGLVSKIRVSRGFFSGPYQSCVRMRMQGVHGEMWPVSCGSAATGTSMSSSEAVLRMHALGMRTRCTDQRNLDGDRARSGPRGVVMASRRAALGMRSLHVVPLEVGDVAVQGHRYGGGVSDGWSRFGVSFCA